METNEYQPLDLIQGCRVRMEKRESSYLSPFLIGVFYTGNISSRALFDYKYTYKKKKSRQENLFKSRQENFLLTNFSHVQETEIPQLPGDDTGSLSFPQHRFLFTQPPSYLILYHCPFQLIPL